MIISSGSFIDLSVSPSSTSSSNKRSRASTKRSKYLPFLPSSQEQEHSLLDTVKFHELVSDHERATSPDEMSYDCDSGRRPECEYDASEGEDLVREAKALQAGMWRNDLLSFAEDKKRMEKQGRQALLDIIRSRKKQRRSRSIGSDTSSGSILPETSSAQRGAAQSTPPTSTSMTRHPSPGWTKTLFSSPMQAAVSPPGSETRHDTRDHEYGEEPESDGGLDAEEEAALEEEQIPWSSSPVLGGRILVPDSDPGEEPVRQVQPPSSPAEFQPPLLDSPPRSKRKRRAPSPIPVPIHEIVDLVSDEEEQDWDNELYPYEPMPHTQFSSQPAPPSPRIWDVPDSSEPDETFSVTLLHDLNQTDRDFFENHFRRPARGQIDGESGAEKQARNMALGIGTAKEAAAKKRASAGKKPWSRGSWGRGRGKARGRGRK